MPAPGDLLADRYRIIGPLGSGGMATVHRAHDDRLGRDVAVKMLLPNLAGDAVTARRFEREARAMATVTHPGLVAVFDVDAGDPAAGREPFVVMELCPGGSLADRLGPDRPIPPDELIPILAAVGDALGALHHAGLAHRDVKPSNILFAADRVKLGDFGIARSGAAGDATDLTDAGTALGTLAYVAPERLRGDPGGPPADVYALATIAHLGLTGRLPRAASSLQELVAAAPFRAPSVSSHAPALGSSFDAVVVDGLAVDPGRRPDAVTFGARLAAALGAWTRAGRPGGQPEATIPPPAPAADEATTAMAIPVAATAPIPTRATESVVTGPPAGVRAPATSRRQSPRSRARIAEVAAIIVVLAVAAAAVVGALSGIGRGASPVPGSTGVAASELASVTPGPSPSASTPRSASPPPAASVDPAFAAVDDMASAIAAARGGRDGLKGKEANELESRLGRVRTALEDGDRSAALDAARDLADQVEKLSKGHDSNAMHALRAAAATLVDALGG